MGDTRSLDYRTHVLVYGGFLKLGVPFGGSRVYIGVSLFMETTISITQGHPAVSISAKNLQIGT